MFEIEWIWAMISYKVLYSLSNNFRTLSNISPSSTRSNGNRSDDLFMHKSVNKESRPDKRSKIEGIPLKLRSPLAVSSRSKKAYRAVAAHWIIQIDRPELLKHISAGAQNRYNEECRPPLLNDTKEYEER